MKVYITSLSIEGADLEGENPLPLFRNRNHHMEVRDNGSLKQDQRANLGYETGERYLPYRMKDRYSRNRRQMEIKTIVLENDILQAVFLPEYGGRLYSLKDKRSGKEILYKNPVFQPANLAILNAWFSGGIEWNVGQVGHAFTTCSLVHGAKLVDDEGNEFLRIYEYERCKNIFWHIDFHLPHGSDKLMLYARIVNDNKVPVPMYWWTNIAVEETPKVRVFSATNQVIHLDQKLKGLGYGSMPYLPSAPDIDVSYPMKIPFSNEYFFQTPEDEKAPWEAVVYEDGRMFYERSTSKLRYRKMFCWGNHAGGRRWCDFLSRPGEGNYIELQGGLAPTQLHGLDMPGQTEWEFTQVIGMSHSDTCLTHQESWDDACDYVRRQVEGRVSGNDINHIHEKLREYSCREPGMMLHLGSGWGALEFERRQKCENRGITEGFRFIQDSMGTSQGPWLQLLQTGCFPDADVDQLPVSWMVQDEWRTLLEESLMNSECQSWNAWMHYGVMLYEKGDEVGAVEAWEKSIQCKPSPWVFRNLAVVAVNGRNNEKALQYFERAYEISSGFPDRAFAEEYLSLLIRNGLFEKAWYVYETLPECFRTGDRLQIIMGRAALELGREDYLQGLFNTEFAVIREGEIVIVELWVEMHARKLAKERNVEMTDGILKEVMDRFPPPGNIDFRVSGSY